MADDVKIRQHEIIAIYKQYCDEHGKLLSRDEFVATARMSQTHIEKYFGTFTAMQNASGLAPRTRLVKKYHTENPFLKLETFKLEREYQKICSKKEQIQGFFRHTLDLKELFKKAGNPEVLKVSAQPDTHVKFRDVAAINCYIKFLKYYKPDVHIIMGDFLDCEGLSHWPSADLEPRRIVPEIKEGKLLLAQIVQNTPECSTRIFLTGNHSHWIQLALSKMPELFDGLNELGIEISLESLLDLKGFGYELFPLNHLVQIGKANFTHGIFTGGSHAKKHLDTFKANIFYGHLHDTQQHNQTSMDGPLVAQSLGCLCRLDAKFLKGRPNNWVHAHGIFEFFPDGSFTYMVPQIINGKMSFNGEVFDGNV